VHQVPLHNKESPDFLLRSIIINIYFNLNCASGAAPQQGVAAPDRALYFCFILFKFIHLNLFELCIRCRSTTWSQGTGWGTRLFLFFFLLMVIINLIDLNCASGAAPQQGLVAVDKAPAFCFISFKFIYSQLI
jgi:hypothetical protein